MAATLEEIEKRLTTLEQQMACLRQQVGRFDDELPAGRGERLLRHAAWVQQSLASGWATALDQMGIGGPPLKPEQVQQMIGACGPKPEDNEFSRGVVKMREE